MTFFYIGIDFITIKKGLLGALSCALMVGYFAINPWSTASVI